MSTEFKATATIKDRDNGYDVDVTWSGPVDRKDGTGFGLPSGHRKLAERLVRAINSGAVFTNPTLQKDINGKTYVQSDIKVLGRRLNRDLERIGF